MRKLLAVVLSVVALAGCSGWAKIAPVLVDVISAIVDAVPIIDEIVSWVQKHFMASPDALAERTLAVDISECRSALVNANRMAHSGDVESTEEAMAEFRSAWAKLDADLKKLSGVKQTPAGATVGYLVLVDEKTGEILNVPVPEGAKEPAP